MTQDYYAPHPRLALDQPLVLIGHPGAGVDQVGRMISGRTGLVFSDVARSVESRAGGSRSRVLVEQGLERLRALEAAALETAVHRRPFGVVVMESGPIEDPARRAWLVEHARVVYVQRPFASLLRRIQRAVERAPGSLPEFLMGAPEREEDLREHLAAREAALVEIPVIVEAGDAHPARIADEILACLDHLIGVERI